MLTVTVRRGLDDDVIILLFDVRLTTKDHGHLMSVRMQISQSM